MRQVYPVAYDKVTWSQRPLFDATGEDYDTTTSAGERKLWEELNKMGEGTIWSSDLSSHASR